MSAARIQAFCFIRVFSAQVKVFVTGLFSLNQDIPAFKEHLRDFLVQIKVSRATQLPYLVIGLGLVQPYFLSSQSYWGQW